MIKDFDFIGEANKVHHGKYDYSKSEYIGKKKNICIICPEHGEFWQTPYKHIRGSGCPKCANKLISDKLKFSKEKIVELANEVHGGKYDYSKSDYVNMNTKMCIICPEHGEFCQAPHNHISKHQGCPVCGGHVLTRDMFIEKANEKHGFKYDYSQVEFTKNKDKITIICPEHGEFTQTVNDHLNGCGCQLCGIRDRSVIRRKPQDDVIEDFQNVHGDRYDYSKVAYVNSNTKVCIVCPKHGDFWQTPGNHLNGAGCPKCKQSMGEAEIRKRLLSEGINFTQEKTFEWLRFVRKQKIDFFLEDYGIAIEYQGEQHFRPVRWGRYKQSIAENDYNLIVERDVNKKRLCEEHGIDVFYITFKDQVDSEMDKILEKIKTQ